jgi:hypothetical protein
MTEPLFDDSSLPPELEDRVRAELRPGEMLLWVGQPRPGRFLLLTLPIVLFGIPWTAFSVFWMVMASGMLFGGPPNGGGFQLFFLLFPLWGVPFVLIGLGMLSAPYWAWRHAKQTCYAVTDQRVLILEGGLFGKTTIRSYGPGALGKMHRTEQSDGSGDLIFEEVSETNGNGIFRRTTTTTSRGFYGIRNVRGVEELVRRVLLHEGAG